MVPASHCVVLRATYSCTGRAGPLHRVAHVAICTCEHSCGSTSGFEFECQLGSFGVTSPMHTGWRHCASSASMPRAIVSIAARRRETLVAVYGRDRSAAELWTLYVGWTVDTRTAATCAVTSASAERTDVIRPLHWQ
jgi:hypothetical protein